MSTQLDIARHYVRNYDLNQVQATEVITGKNVLVSSANGGMFGKVRVTVGTQKTHQTRNIRIGGEIVATVRSARESKKTFINPVVTAPKSYENAYFYQG